MSIAETAAPKTQRADSALNELDLLDRIVAEDTGAFDSLYRAYRPRLRRFISTMTRQTMLVEEVLDDSMMVVWRKAHTYNGTSKVSTWIFAIVYRQTLKALRRAGRDIEADDQGEHDTISPLPGPDAELQRHEQHRHLGKALKALSPEKRAVIELTYYMGYDCREIAQIMGCPVDTVKTRMFYARRKLKDLLALSQEDAI